MENPPHSVEEMTKREIKAEAKQLLAKWEQELREEKEAIQQEARELIKEWFGVDVE